MSWRSFRLLQQFPNVARAPVRDNGAGQTHGAQACAYARDLHGHNVVGREGVWADNVDQLTHRNPARVRNSQAVKYEALARAEGNDCVVVQRPLRADQPIAQADGYRLAQAIPAIGAQAGGVGFWCHVGYINGR